MAKEMADLFQWPSSLLMDILDAGQVFNSFSLSAEVMQKNP